MPNASSLSRRTPQDEACAAGSSRLLASVAKSANAQHGRDIPLRRQNVSPRNSRAPVGTAPGVRETDIQTVGPQRRDLIKAPLSSTQLVLEASELHKVTG
jgi:hypothetical protein